MGELPQCQMGNKKVDNMCFMISCTNWYWTGPGSAEECGVCEKVESLCYSPVAQLLHSRTYGKSSRFVAMLVEEPCIVYRSWVLPPLMFPRSGVSADCHSMMLNKDNEHNMTWHSGLIFSSWSERNKENFSATTETDQWSLAAEIEMKVLWGWN